MAQVVHDHFQPINFNAQIVSLTTASATSSLALPACGAVQIASGGSPLFFSFVASASSGAGTSMMMMPANSVEVIETQGNHTISLKIDGATAPTTVGITPMVGEPRAQPAVLDPDFYLPLTDAGSGAVNLALTLGVGGGTFTRATAAATKLSTGLWKLDVASGVARSCYAGMTTAVGGYSGYLSEPAATQLALNPRDMTAAAWTASNVTTAQTSIGIDGAANSCTRLTASAGNGTVLQVVTAAASSRTYSCWIRRVTGTGEIDITQDGGSTWTAVTSSITTGTFTQVQLNASVLNASFGIRIVTSTDAIDVDCNQFEAGAAATTPIPAAGSRNVDLLTYTALGNYNEAQCTLYAEATVFEFLGITQQIAQVDDGTNNNRFIFFVSSGMLPALNATVAGVGQTAIAGSAVSIGTGFKYAAALAVSDFALSINGSIATSSTIAFPSGQIQAIRVASNVSGASLCGTVKNLQIWKRRLPNAVLQTLTT